MTNNWQILTDIRGIAVTAEVNVSAGAGRAKLIYTTFRHIFDTRVNAMLHITSVISTAGALVVVTA